MLDVETPHGPARVHLRRVDDPRAWLVLGHGAGNDMRSSFMEFFATELVARGLTVVRFNFPYKERTGTRPPDRAKRSM